MAPRTHVFTCRLSRRRGVTMRWFSGLPPCSIRSFSDLATTFESQFVVNMEKRSKVVDLFKTLKQYLARFNGATVQVDDLDQKFFVKAFQKELRASPFSDSLALSRLASMTEIRARAKKQVEA
ncbi:hypothetical protein CR513_57344, partial [Mucuna pruriens]